jgi:DNA-binding transcriptional LysR family regulator
MSLKDLDLNLLKVLDALITERNVTRAGEVLGRSQSAVSNALHRLRIVLGDDLFVRGPNGLEATPRTQALRKPLREAIDLLQASLFENRPFDPALATGIYRISTPDRLSIAVVPRIFDRLRQHAPRMQLHVVTADRDQALELLDEDRLDLALGWVDEKPNHLRAEHLLDEYLYCVVRRDHPIMKMKSKFNIDAVLSFPHIIVSATG